VFVVEEDPDGSLSLQAHFEREHPVIDPGTLQAGPPDMDPD